MQEQWSVFSSYDLEDERDGASLHLADFAQNIPSFCNSKLVLKKTNSKTGSKLKKLLCSNSTIFSLCYSIYFWIFRRNDMIRSTGLFLLGSHIIPFSVFNRNNIYVTLDCWSERERKILYSGSLSHTKYLSRLFYYFLVLFIEKIFISRVSFVLVVSDLELEKYLKKYPFLKGKIFVIPPRPFTLTKQPYVESPIPKDPSILIWMDCRTSYGMESVREALLYLKLSSKYHRFSKVSVLSRTNDSKMNKIVDKIAVNCDYCEDLDRFLEEYDIVILPDKAGSGIKNRTIKAAIEGKIILCRPEALEGFDIPDKSKVAALYENEGQFLDQIGQIISGEKWDCRSDAFDFFSKYSENKAEYRELWLKLNFLKPDNMYLHDN